MADLIGQLKDAIGADHVLVGEAAQEQAHGWTRLGTPIALVRAGSTSDVSAVLRLCHAARQPVVAWGGKTGLVEGGLADGAVAVSLERMNRVEAIDPVGGTMTVQAGCTLQGACEAAEQKDLFFPLDLGARGSASIGGNISTNAGGNRVLRYGMMRELVLGLEAVLADGTVLSALNRLIKNNAGYDVKQLFIGTEGTLGIVTRAVLRLRPKPTVQNVALVAIDAFSHVTQLLRFVENKLGGGLSAFEVMWSDFYALVTTPPANGTAPLPHGHGYYVLIESLGADESENERFERVLGDALEEGFAADAVIAKSQAERNRIWALRDDVGQVMRAAPIFTFDVSLPIATMEDYVAGMRRALQETWPGSQCFVFGHLGDGNLHVIPGGFPDRSAETREKVEEIVYGPLQAIHGSVSAEHGIGLEKRAWLSSTRNAAEIALMRTLKHALDPYGILSPGKVIPVA